MELVKGSGSPETIASAKALCEAADKYVAGDPLGEVRLYAMALVFTSRISNENFSGWPPKPPKEQS
jgi:hypothetical protein